MRISLIAAMATNGVIGKNGKLPWRLPADMAWFKKQTLGKPVIMGRKTWNSINPRFRPLSGRTNIVLSKSLHLFSEGIKLANTLEAALHIARNNDQAEEVMIIGGASVYTLALPIVDRLYLTKIHAEIEGDTFFPQFDDSKWHEIFRTQKESLDGLDYSFVILDCKKDTLYSIEQ